MRVIAGKYRGRKFDAPEGYDTTRPTLDRVKEAMFSIIGFKIDDAVVYFYSETQPTTAGNFWHVVDETVTEWADAE